MWLRISDNPRESVKHNTSNIYKALIPNKVSTTGSGVNITFYQISCSMFTKITWCQVKTWITLTLTGLNANFPFKARCSKSVKHSVISLIDSYYLVLS